MAQRRGRLARYIRSTTLAILPPWFPTSTILPFHHLTMVMSSSNQPCCNPNHLSFSHLFLWSQQCICLCMLSQSLQCKAQQGEPHYSLRNQAWDHRLDLSIHQCCALQASFQQLASESVNFESWMSLCWWLVDSCSWSWGLSHRVGSRLQWWSLVLDGEVQACCKLRQEGVDAGSV